MKLSEAMMLGDSLRKRNHRVTLMRMEGTCVGCAIGGAILAVGGTSRDEFEQLFPWVQDFRSQRGKSVWYEVSGMFFKVAHNWMPLEEIADWVRSIEPECGECNCFDCICPKVQQETPQVVEVTA